MESLTLTPVNGVSGEIQLPGSKSLSNRALLLAALAHGETTITNLLDSDDIRHMLNALKQLGVYYSLSDDKTECTIHGVGGFFNVSQAQELFLGNAGTAMRPLCAALAASKGSFVLTGEPRMKERPIAHLTDALIQLGADINFLEMDGYPPMQIQGKELTGGHISIDGSVSSQFLTAVLMIAPLLNQDTQIDISGELVSKPYIELTLQIIATFGAVIEHNDYQTFTIKGGQVYRSPDRYMVEGDASSASYFLAAAAIKGGTVRVRGIGTDSTQGDIHFADVLEAMGASVTRTPEYIEVTRGSLTAVDMDMNHIPDAAMTIATTALFAEGTTCIRNIYNWRVKETDRLSAMATELRKVGATVIEGDDFIEITPPTLIKHAEIATYDDHRMAMCFSLINLAQCGITILDPGCTSKTFPDYFTKYQSICQA